MKSEHPAYGTACVYRATGRFDNLFKSDISTSSAICLQICRASTDEVLGRDHVHPGKQIVEVYFSPLQWAELLSSVGIGEGTPCTINRVQGEKMEEVPDSEPLARRVATQFAEELGDLSKFCKDAGRLVDDALSKGGKMKAADRDQIREVLKKLTKVVTDSGPFLMKQTETAVNRMASEAQASIRDHAQRIGVSSEVAELAAGTFHTPEISPGTYQVGSVPETPPYSQPVIPDLPERAIESMPIEDMGKREVAERINQHLKRLERDKDGFNRTRDEFQNTSPFYGAGCFENTHQSAVYLVYISYQGTSTVLLDDAKRYLQMLDDGFEGRHFEALRNE